MKTFGKIYVDSVKYNIIGKKPLFEKGWSQETEHPFRKGTCAVVRMPFTKKALAVGLWGAPATNPDEAIMAVLAPLNRELKVTVEDIRAW